jgi:FixJ family two-component response regulator
MLALRRGDSSLTTISQPIVVIVDDDIDVRESLTSFLRAAGLSVVSYPSAKDALLSGMLQKAACVITDLRMPGMHGLELEKLLKMNFPEIPVLLMTGHDLEMPRPAALGETGTRLFLKPIDADRLLRAVRELLR